MTAVTKAPECVLCRRTDSAVVQAGARYAPQVEVRRCANCGLVFSWPRPAEEELHGYYGKFYRQEYTDPTVSERYRADVDEARVRAHRLLSLFEPNMRLLELGCGSGAFLGAVRPYVGEVLGVEPDAVSRAWIEQQLGLAVRERLTDVLSSGKVFELVVLFHVLEHVPEPIRFLQTLRQLLGTNSRLVLEVPNVDDALVTVYQITDYVRFYYQKAHLYYYSIDTLRRMLKEAGFDATVKGIQRYDLSNHIRWMLTGQPGGQGYYDGLRSLSLQAAYADALIRAGHSDTLWAIARRSDSVVPMCS